MVDLWLIRHGETDWNRERRIQGQQQNPLSALGVKQARRLGARLEAEVFDTVYSSDLERALQTARLAVPDAELCQDVRLREISRGVLEGKTRSELTEKELAFLEMMKRDRLHIRPSGGENFQDVRERLEDWLTELQEGKVAAFTHGGIVHSALYLTVGQPSTWSFAINNTSITRLLIGKDHTTLSFVNDHAHVMGRDDVWSF